MFVFNTDRRPAAVVLWSFGMLLVCTTLSADSAGANSANFSAETSNPASPEEITDKSSGSTLELRRSSLLPSTTMSDGNMRLRTVAGGHDVGRMTSSGRSVVEGGSLIHDARDELILQDGFESGDLQNWSGVVGG